MFRELALYSLSALILILGGVALFKQKIYVDEKTGEIIEIELPFFGKLKTNLPAVSFAFIGAGLAAYTLYMNYEVKDQWLIKGQFIASDSKDIEWSKGYLTIFPTDFKPLVNPTGSFDIHLLIPRGYEFEDVVKEISYSNGSGKSYIRASIMVSEEYKSYKKGKNSILTGLGDKTREYKPIEVSVVPAK